MLLENLCQPFKHLTVLLKNPSELLYVYINHCIAVQNLSNIDMGLMQTDRSQSIDTDKPTKMK